MSTFGVYDYDFFTYENVIPNLEAAKLVTYYRQHNQIAVLSPTLNPGPYTKFFIRKEYDDGNFPREFFYRSSEYGGRAFTEDKIYIPLPPKIEQTIPDMHLYDPYIHHFGRSATELVQIKRILNCAHIRLAPDSKHLLDFDELARNFENPKVSGIFLHDYDLASLKPYDLIVQLSNQREYKSKEGLNPYPVGNKFPIRVYSPEELAQWSKVHTIPGAFFLEYFGLMTDEVLNKICLDNKRMTKQIWYNVSFGCSGENDFFINRLPKIFVQVLFLRRANTRILLNYDKQIIKTKELQDLLELLNNWLRFSYMKDFAPHTQNLYKFCRDNTYLHYTTWAFQTVTLNFEEIRNAFQYIRENNYDLFKKFYEWDEVKFDGRNIINEWN